MRSGQVGVQVGYHKLGRIDQQFSKTLQVAPSAWQSASSRNWRLASSSSDAMSNVLGNNPDSRSSVATLLTSLVMLFRTQGTGF